MTGRARGLVRHGRTLLAVGGLAAAAAGAAFAPLPPGFTSADARTTSVFAAVASAALVGVLVLPLLMRRNTARRQVWLLVAILTLLAGLASFSSSGYTQRRCTARYFGTQVIIGTELTELGRAYTRRNPDETPDDILEASKGQVDWAWTRESIARCRVLIASTYYLWIPFLVVCLVAGVQLIPSGGLQVAAGAAPARRRETSGPPVYDVFISYRHGERDADVAVQILEALEADGYTVAIDERDFPANAAFLEEMERCIRQSRFTLAVVSNRYLESGNCQEEAVLCKVLDMGERRRRLIPLVIEPVSMPAWLYGLVGIYCTKADPLVDPLEKLKATLGVPLSQAPRASV